MKMAGKTLKNIGKRQEREEKVSGKILELCQERSTITVPEMAQIIGISERSVLRHIKALQEHDLLHRAGGRKEGYWEVRDA